MIFHICLTYKCKLKKCMRIREGPSLRILKSFPSTPSFLSCRFQKATGKIWPWLKPIEVDWVPLGSYFETFGTMLQLLLDRKESSLGYKKIQLGLILKSIICMSLQKERIPHILSLLRRPSFSYVVVSQCLSRM